MNALVGFDALAQIDTLQVQREDWLEIQEQARVTGDEQLYCEATSMLIKIDEEECKLNPVPHLKKLRIDWLHELRRAKAKNSDNAINDACESLAIIDGKLKENGVDPETVTI